MKKNYFLAFLLPSLLFFNAPRAVTAQPNQQTTLTSISAKAEEPATLFPAEIPKISVQRGFYKKPFDVVISTGVDDMKIYYTLDGSDPATSESAMVTSSPAKVKIDPQSFLGAIKKPSVILRARAKSDNYNFSPIATRTYLFIDQIKNQANPPGYSGVDDYINNQYLDYTLLSEVLNDSKYANLIDDALLEVPSISITTDNANLFDPDSGIYVNAWDARGIEWERPASVELINPDGTKDFQIDAGIRIRGGWSRNGNFRKHAFRLFFRTEYGEGKLDFPLFGDEGVKSFDKIDLRCAQNYSWSKGDGDESPLYTFTRDVFSRDVQGKMNQEYTRSRYYHLYLNGLYWGLYQTQERSDAKFAADYMGGNSEDYDVIKREGGEDRIEANDGTLDAWKEVWNLCEQGFSSNKNYYKIQGLNESGVRDPNLKVLVDIDNLIDYMNIIFYTGNFDAPYSSFSRGPNNFYAIYNRNGDDGFKFFAHDNEHTLLIKNVPGNPNAGLNENRVNLGSKSIMKVTDFEQFQPQWLHYKLSENAEYCQRFSDRSTKQYYNNGVFTPEKAIELFRKRTLEIDTAVIAESARWGDDESGKIMTKDNNWTPTVEDIITKFFPFRTNIVIKQLQDEGLLSTISAPVFTIDSKEINDENIKLSAGDALTIVNSSTSGNVTYTIDGSDPRLVGDAISSSAINGGTKTTISVLQTCIVKARIFDNGIWSSLRTLNISVDSHLDGLQLTEIHYNPLGQDGLSGNGFEFLELKNSGVTPINLTSALFIDGITFNFQNESILDPGKFIVLASNAYTFNLRYGFSPFGEYSGKLDNSGERITLVNAVGDTILTVKYNDNEPWPSTPDSLGFSLVPAVKDISADWNDGANWRASSAINGSPNADDANIDIPEIVISEILTNSEAPMVDAIELFNPTTVAVNIGGWYLSDDKDTPKKWKIPAETFIPANGYLVLNEGHFESNNLQFNSNEFGSSFSLSSLGDEIYIFSGIPAGGLTGYVFGFDFGAIEPGISFGSYVNSIGKTHFVAQQSTSFNAANGLPRVGPVIIDQLMYNPGPDQFEYLKLVNNSTEAVNFFDETQGTPWKVSGIDFEFPKNIVLAAGQTVYLIEHEVSPSDFKALFNLDSTVLVFNFNGGLKNEGEEITLLKSYESFVENNDLKIPYIRIDKVDYNNNSNWPDASGNGYVLERIDSLAYGNDPASWIATPPGMRIKNSYLADAIEGVYYSRELSVLGGTAPFSWSTSGDGLPDGLTLNPVTGLIDGIPTQSGTFILNFKVEDSGNTSKEVELSLLVRQNTMPVAVNDTISFRRNHLANLGVLFNDFDDDGDKASWNIEVKTQPAHGICSVNNDKTITITPDRDFMGLDSMTYQVSDIKGSSEAKVMLYVYDDVISEFTYTNIKEGSDDAEENIITKEVSLTSPSLEFTYDSKIKANQLVGLRFSNFKLPEGARVQFAEMLFFASGADASPASLTIRGEASPNAKTYTKTELISSRPTTTNTATWNPAPTSQTYENMYTPDLSPILNEIIDMGWESGNSFAFVISGEGSRSVRSFNSNEGAAAYLLIQYTNPTKEVTTPIAVITDGLNIGKGDVVQLDGTSSKSTDTRSLNFYWSLTSIPEGSNAQLSNQNNAMPTFVADQFGVYEVSLKVDNGYKESETVSISISVSNQQPIVNAGSDQTRSRGSIIRLNGSGSTDADGDAITYNWKWIQKPTGSTAQLSSASEANPKFTADLEGKYILSLTVTDNYLSSSTETVEINIIANQPPLANAGNDVNVVTGSQVVLNGTNSSDPEEDPLTFSWSIVSKPEESKVVLSNNTISKPAIQPDVAGQYIFQLTVSDGTNTSVAAEVKVTAENNLPPFAVAGNDQVTTEHLTVALDGSESYDPDAKPLIYQWSFITKPFSSNASIMSANTAKPTFQPDTEGLYTIKLRISDGTFTSEDLVQITALNNVKVVDYKEANALNAYPNPFTNKLVVEYFTTEKQNVEFSLYNITGAVVGKYEYNTSGKCTQVLHFDNENLKSGLYLLIMKTDNGEPQAIKVIHK